MSFKIITADERLATYTGIKAQIWGKYGIGKTSLAWTLPPETTLVLDLEAGLTALEGWQGRSVSVRTWEDCRDLACWIGGPNPALRPDQSYSHAHYEYVLEQHGPFPEDIEHIFVDSMSNAGRYCLQWAKGQPAAFSEKTGKYSSFGAYGLLGQELIAFAEQWQHIPDKNVWLLGGLEEKTDDFNRVFWQPLLDGSKATNTLPYIFDLVITMAQMTGENNEPFRGLVCTQNLWKYPAKDRSGRLAMIEPPHLGKLYEKIKGTARKGSEIYQYETKELS